MKLDCYSKPPKVFFYPIICYHARHTGQTSHVIIFRLLILVKMIMRSLLRRLSILKLRSQQLMGRHKLYKSGGDPRIFRRCLLFDIGRSSSDFLDLEPCGKSHAVDACRPPLGDCSATARFALQMTKFSVDVPMTIGRRPSGDCRDTCQSPSNDNKPYDHRQVAVWASCGHLRVRYG